MLFRVVAKRLDAVLVVVELLEQARMSDREVIALEVVVDIHLPVALDDVVAALDPAHGGQVVAGFVDLVGDHTDPVGQRRCLVIEVGEDERAQRVDLDRHQAKVCLVEILSAIHLTRHLQPAVQPVHPAVIPALQRLPVASRGHDLRCAVAAHVVETAKLFILWTRE